MSIPVARCKGTNAASLGQDLLHLEYVQVPIPTTHLGHHYRKVEAIEMTSGEGQSNTDRSAYSGHPCQASDWLC